MVKQLVEVPVKYACGNKPSLDNKTGDWRFMTPVRVNRLSPCREACLLDGAVPQWLEAVKRERWDEAWSITSRSNPFPAITGHVCFNPCMESCNRRLLDEGIGIREVEKAVGLWRLDHYRPPTGLRVVRGTVAVVGSGPAGLSCAYYLSREGFRVTVFERAAVSGGLLALGIPEYRLPRAVLSRELQILEAEGVNFELNCALGDALELAEVAEQHDAVFLATGAQKAAVPPVPGADLPGVWSAIDYLSRVNLGQPAALAEPVVVVGGGNAAVDAARMALRDAGAGRVSVVYRRGREEMPASPDEVEAAEAEGVKFLFNTLPRSIQARGERIESVLLDRSETAPDGAVKIAEGPPVKLPCGSLIFATGQEPDFSVFGPLREFTPLFAGGDLVSGPATVAEAIRAGRLAALSIAAGPDGREQADGNPRQPKQEAVTFEELNLQALPTAHLSLRQDDPVDEAGRCLGCGNCNSCGICALFCPDVAVHWDLEQYAINLDYCKGCGICARECPALALVMEGGTGDAS